VTSRIELEQLQADADYYHDRVALLRAELYRWGLGSNERLQALERELESVRQRLRDADLSGRP
jgi:prefoldin subunit 5